MTNNVKEHAPSGRFGRGKLNGIISQFNISSKRGLFCNSDFSNINYVKYFICALEQMIKSSKFLFKEHALI